MNTQSKLKIFKSGGYDYLYVYYKLGKNMLRIPTNQKVIKGKMTQDLLFSSKVEGYEAKNNEIMQLKMKVDDYVFVKLREYFPIISQKECKKFIQERYMRGDLLSGKRYEPLPEKTDSDKSLVGFIDDYIKYRKDRSTTRNTLKEFTTMKNRVKAFDSDRKATTYLQEINLTWSDAFEKFLLKKQYGSGTIEKTYTILITVLYHYYRRTDELKINLSDKFTYPAFKRGKKSKNLANPLTIEQFELLFNHNFKEPHLELTRLRFCLQCSTGLRFSDIHRITPEMIDKGRIVIKPQKTQHIKNEPIYIDLNRFSQTILEQLNYNTTDLKIENAPYNRDIKTMFQKIQVEKPDLKFKTNYSSHNGRDTFISICVQKGIDYKTILLWTGQSSYSVMDRYISNTDEYKNDQMKKAFG